MLHLVKDLFQPAGPLPDVFVFRAKGLQFTAKLFLFFLDDGKFPEPELVLEVLVALLLKTKKRRDKRQDKEFFDYYRTNLLIINNVN